VAGAAGVALRADGAEALLSVNATVSGGTADLAADRIAVGASGSVMTGTGAGNVVTLRPTSAGRPVAFDDAPGDPAGELRLADAGAASNPGAGFAVRAGTALATVGTVDGVAGVTTAGGPITLTADDLAIFQAVNAGAGRVTLQPATAGRAISLGADAAGSLGLT